MSYDIWDTVYDNYMYIARLGPLYYEKYRDNDLYGDCDDKYYYLDCEMMVDSYEHNGYSLSNNYRNTYSSPLDLEMMDDYENCGYWGGFLVMYPLCFEDESEFKHNLNIFLPSNPDML